MQEPMQTKRARVTAYDTSCKLLTFVTYNDVDSQMQEPMQTKRARITAYDTSCKLMTFVTNHDVDSQIQEPMKISDQAGCFASYCKSHTHTNSHTHVHTQTHTHIYTSTNTDPPCEDDGLVCALHTSATQACKVGPNPNGAATHKGHWKALSAGHNTSCVALLSSAEQKNRKCWGFVLLLVLTLTRVTEKPSQQDATQVA